MVGAICVQLLGGGVWRFFRPLDIYISELFYQFITFTYSLFIQAYSLEYFRMKECIGIMEYSQLTDSIQMRSTHT